MSYSIVTYLPINNGDFADVL